MHISFSGNELERILSQMTPAEVMEKWLKKGEEPATIWNVFVDEYYILNISLHAKDDTSKLIFGLTKGEDE
jgi:hypothetical protein